MKRHDDPNPFDEDHVNPFAVTSPSISPSFSLSFFFILKLIASIETLDLDTIGHRAFSRLRNLWTDSSYFVDYAVISCCSTSDLLN